MDTVQPAAPALSPADRSLLTALLADPAIPLPDLARAFDTDLLGLAVRILAPAFQAALDELIRAAESAARARAVIHGREALSALSDACAATNPSTIERRRAATTILRHAVRLRAFTPAAATTTRAPSSPPATAPPPAPRANTTPGATTPGPAARGGGAAAIIPLPDLTTPLLDLDPPLASPRRMTSTLATLSAAGAPRARDRPTRAA